MIGYSFSFRLDCFKIDNLKQFFKFEIPFTPKSIRLGAMEYTYSHEVIDGIVARTNIEIFDEHKHECIKLAYFGTSKCCALRYVLTDDRLPESLIVKLIGLPSFCIGYIYNHEFYIWQNMKSIDYYDMSNRDHTDLPKIEDEVGDLEIDISRNYGRQEFYFNTILMVAPVMFISDKYKLEFPMVKLKKYFSTDDLQYFDDKKVVKVKLYDPSSHNEEMHNLIKNFWMTFNYDKLIEDYNNSFNT